jgi:hypothetical protein
METAHRNIPTHDGTFGAGRSAVVYYLSGVSMDLFALVAVIGIAVAAYLVFRRSVAQRLQQMSEGLTAIGEASSHPRDVAEHPTFREAVQIYETDVDLGAVTDSVGGAEWWSDHPLIPALLTEHFATRRGRGETLGFGDALSRATAPELTAAEGFLRKIEHPSARELLDALTAFRRTALDREYLQTLGRFVEPDAARHLLVDHDAVKEDLARAGACASPRSPPGRRDGACS